MKYKIGIDISGGDHAPEEIFKGAIKAKNEYKQDIVLIGVRAEIEEQAKKQKVELGDFTIVDAPEKVEMAESPVQAIRKKKNSSISVGLRMLRDKKIDAFVSCGNTGAVVGASTLILGLIEGIERPGIALMLPARKESSLIIDVGANVSPKPLHLLQYGIMASVYYKMALKRDNVTVGLLNIGEEESKGSEFVKNVHKLFSTSSVNFIGNVEAKDIFSGVCNCIVCDGFVGNVALKVTEGCADVMGRFLLDAVKKSFLGKFGLLLVKNSLLKFKKKIDYAEYGGALLLGVDGVVIIGHGRSSSYAVKNAIKVAIRELEYELTSKIKREVNEICQDSRIREVLTA